MSATLYYVHDPMCSWCWGFRPTWIALKDALPDSVEVVNVSGGLARDCDEPMPPELQQTIEGHWRTIENRLGTEFNYDFWRDNQPRRSTYVSCRAAIAAAYQGAEEAMIEAIQQAYYLRALNPSDVPILLQLAAELNLGSDQFARDLQSAQTQAEFERQMALARRLPISGFPSLVLAQGEQTMPVDLDYQKMEGMLAEIRGHLAA